MLHALIQTSKVCRYNRALARLSRPSKDGFEENNVLRGFSTHVQTAVRSRALFLRAAARYVVVGCCVVYPFLDPSSLIPTIFSLIHEGTWGMIVTVGPISRPMPRIILAGICNVLRVNITRPHIVLRSHSTCDKTEP